MRLFPTQYAAERVRVLSDSALGFGVDAAYDHLRRGGVDLYEPRSDRRPRTEQEEAKHAATVAAMLAAREDVERYIATLEDGARCAYDTLVSEGKAAASVSRRDDIDEGQRAWFRKDAKRILARAREIAQAFKAEGVAA